MNEDHLLPPCPPVTVDSIRAEVEQIERLGDTLLHPGASETRLFEMTSRAYRRVLDAIATGLCGDPAGCAREVLELEDNWWMP